MLENLAVWVSIFLSVAAYSLLYKENPWFRVAESVYLGTAIGYGVAFDLKYLQDQWSGMWSSTGIMMTAFSLASLMGLLWYFRFSKKYFYLYRLPLAVVVGTGLGMSIPKMIFAQILKQMEGQMSIPLFESGNLVASISNILVFIMVSSVLLYFWFTGRPSGEKGVMLYIDKIARYTMMAGFGAAFGAAVLARYTRFSGVVQALLGIAPNPPEGKFAFILFSVIILGSLLGWDLYKRKSAKQ